MYLLYTDESNASPQDSGFFVYAGVAIPTDHAATLSQEIDTLRRAHGYGPLDVLKFDTVSRPTNISPDTHKQIKKDIMTIIPTHGVKLFVVFTLHEISVDLDKTRKMSISSICYHFDCFLNRIRDSGLILIDRFQDSDLVNMLKERFLVGVCGLPYSETYRLTNVLGFHLASIGSSHFSSIADIVLGGLRYAINQRNDPRSKPEVIQELLAQIALLFVRNEPSNKVSEVSILFSPKSITVPKYLQAYQELYSFLATNGIEAAQIPIERIESCQV